MRAPRSARVKGFTLIELMTAVGIAAILLTVAVPGFENTIHSGRLTGAANELLVSLQTARMEAIRFNRSTVVCLSSDAEAASPHCVPAGATDARGWITFVDNNGDRDFGTGDRLLRGTSVHDTVNILASVGIPGKTRVTYGADGFARDTTGTAMLAGAIDLCLPTRRPLENVRRVSLLGGGRVVIEQVDAGGHCNAPEDPA